jgi:hypothetical protein
MEKQMNIKRAFFILMAAIILPNIAMAQITARFEVNKVFTDGFTGEVEVTLVCNTGVPLTQSAMVSEGNPVTFVVLELDIDPIGDPTVCDITEVGAAGHGYAAVYDATGADESLISCNFDSGGVFENLNPLNECDIVNTPLPIPVVITKEWVMTGAGGNTVDTDIYVTVYSDGEIDVVDGGGYSDCYLDHELGNGIGADFCVMLYFSGNETRAITVRPLDGLSVVFIDEEVFDSSVETDNGCGGSVTVTPGGLPQSCLITNTVFFEGIPTLNQYGLAIMALLMLGVGFVGFRRFV